MTTDQTIDGVPLLPCPFCGKKPRYVPADYIDNHGQPWPFAECNPCNVGAPVEFWNKRAAQPQGEPVAWMFKRKDQSEFGKPSQHIAFASPDLEECRTGKNVEGRVILTPRDDYFDWRPLYAEQTEEQ